MVADIAVKDGVTLQAPLIHQRCVGIECHVWNFTASKNRTNGVSHPPISRDDYAWSGFLDLPRQIFATTGMAWVDWGLAVGVASSVLLLEEVRKLSVRAISTVQMGKLNKIHG
jgi:hypothetical protein